MNRLFSILFIVTLVSCTGKHKKFNELSDRDFKHETAIINKDTIYFKSAETANDKQKFMELDSIDKAFLINCRKAADSLIISNYSEFSIKNYTPKLLDKLIDLYNSDKLKCSKDIFVNSIGVAMGDYLVENLKMKWIIVEDEYGREFGTTIDKIRYTNFPINSVLKAIEQKREGSMHTIYLLNLKTVSELTGKQ
jgi:hypothetical protein